MTLHESETDYIQRADYFLRSPVSPAHIEPFALDIADAPNGLSDAAA
jgi:hypothetical protein